ncbi:hypothetical protein D3C80_1021490 [compost metagenome]
MLLTNVLCVVDSHRFERIVHPGVIQQHPALQAINRATAFQPTRQRLVIEHRAKPGMQAEQRCTRAHAAIEQQQRVQAGVIGCITRQLGDGRPGNHITQFQFDGQILAGTDLGQHLEHAQRITAQLEEVVIDPDLLHVQHFLPDRCQRLLDGIARGNPRPACGKLRCRQAIAVDLAIGRERQCRHQHQLCRHHVFRQVGAQGIA